MDILDFHTHVFPDDIAPRAIEAVAKEAIGLPPTSDGTERGLLVAMNEAGISQSVLLPVATKVTQVTAINRRAALFDNDALIPFGALHPDSADFESEISFLKNNGIVGVKMHPEYQQFAADDRRVYPLYEELAHHNMILLLHAGKDPYPVSCGGGHPVKIAQVKLDFPGLTLVAAHMGGWCQWDESLEYLAGNDIYFDTSAISYRLDPALFMKIARKNGMDHILFGSDSPWLSQQSAVAYIEKLPIRYQEKEMIFFNNAKKLLTQQ